MQLGLRAGHLAPAHVHSSDPSNLSQWLRTIKRPPAIIIFIVFSLSIVKTPRSKNIIIIINIITGYIITLVVHQR